MTSGRLVLHRYHTSVDRAGAAIAAGGLICGVLSAVLLAMGGQPSVFALVAALLVGGVLAAMGITAIAAPLWFIMHINGLRAPGYAALVGAAIGFVLFLAAQTHGLGLAESPPSDQATQMMRWISAAATGLVLALVAALIALAMWRVAYRRVT